MPRKLESLFKKFTGVDPKQLEPKPGGTYMQKAIRAAKAATGEGGVDDGVTLFQIGYTPTFFVERVDKTSEGPLTVIRRELNGATEYAILFDVGLSNEDVEGAASLISPGDWFTLDQAAL